MHLAICDDNIADRKHLERLLLRESDARAASHGILYVDAFGSMESISRSPMIYDMFFIDMTGQPPHGIEVAIALRSMGVTAPIVLCCSTIAYRSYAAPPEEIYYIDKPFSPKELSEMVDLGYNRKTAIPPTIEIRGDDGSTTYVREEEIIYIYPGEHSLKVVLNNGDVVPQHGILRDFIPLLEPYPEFILLGKKYIVNKNHIQCVSGKNAILSDGTKIPLSLIDKHYLKK